MSLRDSWDIPAPQSEGEAAGQKTDRSSPIGQDAGEGSPQAAAREPHWRDFARGEAKDFMWSADRHFADMAGENEVHALRQRVEDIADQLAGFARQRSETAIARAPAPSYRGTAPAGAPRPREDAGKPRAERGQIEIIERTIHDIIRHLEASDRHHAEALRQMQGDIQMLLDRSDAEPSDGVIQDMEAAFSRIEERIHSLAARIEQTERPQPAADMSRIEARLSSLAEAIDKLAHGDGSPARAGGDGDSGEMEAAAPAEADFDAEAEDETATAEAMIPAEPEDDAEAQDQAEAAPEAMAPAESESAAEGTEDYGAEFDLVFEAITDTARAAENDVLADGGAPARDSAGDLLSDNPVEDATSSDDADVDFAGAKERLSDFMQRQERRRQRLRAQSAALEINESEASSENPEDPLDALPTAAKDNEAEEPSMRPQPEMPAPRMPAAEYAGGPQDAEPFVDEPANEPVADLAGEIDRRAEMLDARLAERFAELSARLQTSLREAGDGDALAGLKGQVGDMAARLDELAARPRDDGDAELKSQIGDLAERLAAAEVRFASFDTLEHTMSELTARLDKAEETLQQSARAGRADAKELDRQFAALFEQLEVSRESMLNAARLAATEIAETAASESAKKVAEDAVRQAQRAAVTAACEAARQAVAEADPTGVDNGEGKIISQLRDSLLELRAEIRSNDREGRAALDAVEDNLRAMALRLDDVEARGSATPDKPKQGARDLDRGEEMRRRESPGELPDDLAALRLPPLEIGEAAIPEPKADPEVADDGEREANEMPGGADAELGASKGAESIADREEDAPEADSGLKPDTTPQSREEMPLEAEAEVEPEADSLRRREPGSGPPSAIMESLGLGLPTKVDKRDLSAPRSEAGAAARPAEESAPIPSLGGARTTNELLAAARRAAEAAAAGQAHEAEKDRQNLRDRLRIPLSRKDGNEKSGPAAAKEKPVKRAKVKTVSAKGEAGKPAVRKPILLAAAAVILIAGSFEIYNMLSSPKGEVIDAAPVVNPEPLAAPPEATGGDPENSPGAAQESRALEDHLPEHGGAAPETGEPSANPAETAPAQETTSSLSIDPRTEASPRPQPDSASAAQLPPLPEAVGPAALRDAALGGDPVAQFEIASRLAEGRGIDPDIATAAKWYQLAADSGLAPAQYRLGSLLEKGTGIAKDRAGARTWYQRAAEQGNRKAMHNLAVLYADGIKGQPDFANAARWFQAAAELGLNDSQYNLGILHVRGLGVPQNLAEAYKWFAILASHGDKDAAQRRDAVAGQMDAGAVAAARLAAKTWKAKPLIAQANAVRLPDSGWAAPGPASEPALPGPEIIRTAQRLLSLGGYQPGPADGRWGPMTQTAIRSFQRDAGLDATGELTPQLLQKLHSRLAG